MSTITMTVLDSPDGGAKWRFDGFDGDRFPDTPAGWLCACVSLYLQTYGAQPAQPEGEPSFENGDALVEELGGDAGQYQKECAKIRPTASPPGRIAE